MLAFSLTIFAGSEAQRRLHREGWHPELFELVLGASGAAKWLSISQLEKALFPWLLQRHSKLSVMGSSIGAWRAICLAQKDPKAALSRLEHAYIHQFYAKNWGPQDVEREAQRILAETLGDQGRAEIFQQTQVVLHILAAHCKGLLAQQNNWLMTLGLAACAVSNLIDRKFLSWYLTRTCFVNDRQSSPLSFYDLPTEYVELNAKNLEKSLLASGSIPGLSRPIERIPSAPQGPFRDGGLTDYHYNFQFHHGSGLILYPHFYPYMIPGWFDKALKGRKIRGEVLDRVVLICPSNEFVKALPYQKIPDRNDFKALEDARRLDYWKSTIASGQQMYDEFLDGVTTQSLTDRMQDFPPS